MRRSIEQFSPEISACFPPVKISMTFGKVDGYQKQLSKTKNSIKFVDSTSNYQEIEIKTTAVSTISFRRKFSSFSRTIQERLLSALKERRKAI